MTEMSDMDKKNKTQNTKQDIKTSPAASANNNVTPSNTTDKTKTTGIANMVRKLLKLDKKKETTPEKFADTGSGNGFVAKLMHFIMKTDSSVVAVASKAQEATQATDKQESTDMHTKSTVQTDIHSLKAKSVQKLGSNADIVLVQKPSNTQEQQSQKIKK